MSNLQEVDKEAAAVAMAPRVSLADIEAAIEARYDFIAGDAIRKFETRYAPRPSLDLLSISVLVMKNGFTIIGKSAPASPANFNEELGRKLAYEDAVRQLWPLMGYALREKLATAA